jgi:hypothetical protein
MTRLGLAQFEMETFVSQRDMQNFLGQRLRDAADVCGYSYRGHASPRSPDRLPENQRSLQPDVLSGVDLVSVQVDPREWS